MARRSSVRRSSGSRRSSRVSRAAPRRGGGGVRRVRSRGAAPRRNAGTTVRVVVQAAPAPVASAAPGAVSMTTLKKARF